MVVPESAARCSYVTDGLFRISAHQTGRGPDRRR